MVYPGPQKLSFPCRTNRRTLMDPRARHGDGSPARSAARSATQTTDRNLVRSMVDAGFYGGMIGCGETYFAAFALAAGLGETAAGLVASVPLVTGGTLQLISPWAIAWLGDLRRWIVLGAVLQALTFLPLALAAWQGSISMTILLVLASLYWASGLATGPAWNTWIERVVPDRMRTRFFSRRTRLQQTTTFAGLLLAGGALQWCSQRGWEFAGFAALFLVAAGCRLLSAWQLYRTGELPPASRGVRVTAKSRRRPKAWRVIAAKRLLVYLVLMQVFLQFSGPYFVPYMLEQLDFSYGTFVLLISLAFVSKVVSMSMWGRVAERAGASRVLWLGGVGLVPLAALWIPSSNVWWLASMQVLSGVAWGAYELGFFLLFFETLPADRRTQLLTLYNFANTAAMAIGAAAGAAFLYHFGLSSRTYHGLFALSSVGRLACLLVLSGIRLPRLQLHSIRLRVLSVRPGAASMAAPVIASASPAEVADSPTPPQPPRGGEP